MLSRACVIWLIQGSPSVVQLTSCVYNLIGEVSKLRTEISKKQQKRKVVYIQRFIGYVVHVLDCKITVFARSDATLDQSPLSISRYSRIVATPPDVLNEIVAALEYQPRLIFEQYTYAREQALCLDRMAISKHADSKYTRQVQQQRAVRRSLAFVEAQKAINV